MNNDRVYYSRDAEVRAMHDTTRIILIYLALGVGIGAAMALLFAPASGQKIRGDLSKSVEEGLNNGRETVEPMVKRLEKEVSELRKSVEDRIPHMK